MIFGNRVFLFLCVLTLLDSCSGPIEEKTKKPALFSLLPESQTGISFSNDLVYTEEFNVYTYRSFYNGAGVGLGDINNDGLLDVFFCGNQVSNKLYLNQGNLKFKDITDAAGLESVGIWSTGVSMVDVNGDGWLDIYVCKSGNPRGERRGNELFINNHDLTFSEKAEEFGINDKGLSTHAVFFDYDKDGDLDCYLLNNSFRSVGNYDLRKNQRKIRDTLGGNKLYRNDRNHFVDVSREAGIYGSSIGFGLGVTVADVNRDGWDDIYVSNDFFERDYLYINDKHGKFDEVLETQINEISMGSMGADVADINNDGFPEIFVTEMLPSIEGRIKTKASFENWQKYRLNFNSGYHRQFPRNVLQLNNGDDTFSEIGRLAGVSATDWSWGALITDLDNDGHKDLFVANGIYKDLLDQDYVNFMADPNTVREILQRDKQVIKRLVDSIPSEPLSNYAFKNHGDLRFSDEAADWGLGTPGFSNGSAYGDLDNDGDLDLIVNNVNMNSFVYQNRSDTLLSNNHYLKFKLEGEAGNQFALGAQVSIIHQGKNFYQELAPMRGFQSTVDARLNFGLGALTSVDTIMVQWPNSKVTLLKNIATNQVLTLRQKDGLPDKQLHNESPHVSIFKNVTEASGIDFRHEENDYVDFDRDRLLYHMVSSEGPRMSQGDVNGDHLEDFYIGGARDQAGALFVQMGSGKFKRSPQEAFEVDKITEDAGSTFFDADKDGDLDLYVCSGSNEFPSISTALIDRLYLNDGKGNFSKSPQVLPTTNFESTSTVSASDYDGDGDQDLFVGVRLQAFKYGMAVNGYILNNDGHGTFKNVSDEVAPGLRKVGMITDGLWADVDGDKDEDLVLVGEWMPIKVFYNESGKLSERSTTTGLEKSHGWWNRLEAADLDGDGDVDFVAGNHGLNSRFKASELKPVNMYVNDFDQNGTVEQIICAYNGEKSYPMALRHDLVQQMPMLKKKYLKYASYKDQTIADIFTEAQMKGVTKWDCYTLSSSVIINEGGGKFVVRALPVEAQFSPIYGIMIDDFDKDGAMDILAGGNFDYSKPEVGSYNASHGTFLRGDNKFNFKFVKPILSGFRMEGQVRDFVKIKIKSHQVVVVSKNNDYVQVFVY